MENLPLIYLFLSLNLPLSAVLLDAFASGNICLIPDSGKQNLGYITIPILLGYDLRKPSSVISMISTHTDRILSFVLPHGYSGMENVYV
jgi:hypothetical protein